MPATPAPAGALAAASEGPNPDGVRAYRLGLARGARAYKRYPELARERGWEGTAEVRVDVSREGRPRQVLLARSSGHELLDREAVAMLARAAAAAAVPESLRGREFAVSLPVLFDLSEP
ncbi:MAG: energy transducer TonB [Rhodocyclales bacterium]|nr:energy transducer TonB [Rhodocyclales bacterium]